MKLRNKIILSLLLIISSFLIADTVRINHHLKPLFVIHAGSYKDGGTKTYYGIGYKVIQWNKAGSIKIEGEDVSGFYKGSEISYFPAFKGIAYGPSDKIPFFLDPVCQPTVSSVRYFSDTVLSIAKRTIPDYDKKGLGSGVDGFNLIKVFNFEPSDFLRVVALGGDYSVKNNELLFTGHAASNSAVLTHEGMRTLLINTSMRLNLPCQEKRSVDSLLKRILR